MVKESDIPKKHLSLQGGYNFRDLGGIKTKDGKKIKWRMLLRGDELHALTQTDLDYLSSIPIVTIVDFRSKEEIEVTPDRLPSSIQNIFQLSIAPGNLSIATKNIDITTVDPLFIKTMMMRLYGELVSDPDSIKQYKAFFALLKDKNNLPLLHHCTAGKDRTGMATALILHALGVDQESIIEDYLLSNKYLASKYDPIRKKYPALASAMGVKKEFLLKGFQTIEDKYNSLDNYLTNILEVDIEQMRKIYLE